jgi:hypothetical protein
VLEKGLFLGDSITHSSEGIYNAGPRGVLLLTLPSRVGGVRRTTSPARQLRLIVLFICMTTHRLSIRSYISGTERGFVSPTQIVRLVSLSGLRGVRTCCVTLPTNHVPCRPRHCTTANEAHTTALLPLLNFLSSSNIINWCFGPVRLNRTRPSFMPTRCHDDVIFFTTALVSRRYETDRFGKEYKTHGEA